MRIQIDGTNTQNKGAELMLYTIIEEIEKVQPDSTIILNLRGKDFNYGPSKLKIKQPYRLKFEKYPRAILSRLNIPYTIFTNLNPIKNINLLLDASGFKFGDQWNYSNKYLINLESYYKKLKDSGTKIILLPQAFGPFNSKSSQKSIEIINKYADIIFARELLSKEYLILAGINSNKIYEYPDFTITAKGVIPQNYNHLKDHVCLIPNNKMLTHSDTNFELYFQLFKHLVKAGENIGKKSFLLNHEGKNDFELCKKINEKLDKKIPIVNNLNALEVKGLISNSHMVVSSRFHGISSALNEGIPCLATSWSHKYEYLFREFGLENNIINLSKSFTNDERIPYLLDQKSNAKTRKQLNYKRTELSLRVQEMWNIIWNYK